MLYLLAFESFVAPEAFIHMIGQLSKANGRDVAVSPVENRPKPE